MILFLGLKIVKSGYCGNWGFIFAWDLGVIFLAYWVFKISKRILFKIQILRFHRKMCWLFPCIPVFRGFFGLKSVKKMCMCVGVKSSIVTYEKCMFWCEKGYKRILALGGPKTYYFMFLKRKKILHCVTQNWNLEKNGMEQHSYVVWFKFAWYSVCCRNYITTRGVFRTLSIIWVRI